MIPVILTVPQTIDSSWSLADKLWPPTPRRTPSTAMTAMPGTPAANSSTNAAVNPSSSASPAAGAGHSQPPEGTPTPQPDASGPACTPTQGSGVVQPSPSKARGLSFCQVLINKGQPITGDGFTLEGQVLGSTTERKSLVLFVRINPTTCDANGKPGAPGRFLVDGVKFDDVDGRWSHRDDFGGYAAGITFGRIFEFATASPAVVRGIMSRRDEWKDNGLTGEMLNAVSFLARFDVQPGQTPGQRSCSG